MMGGKSVLKKVACMTFALCLLVPFVFTTSNQRTEAAEINSIVQPTDPASLIVPGEAEFDLTKGVAQEVSYIDANGNKVTMGAEPEEVADETGKFLPMSTKTLPKGTSSWHIYWYTGSINMSYHIKVKRTSSYTHITSAYNLSITMIGYTESNRHFGHTNTTATYTGTAVIYGGWASISCMLKSHVSGSKLTITARA
jgi:hypothetical protein